MAFPYHDRYWTETAQFVKTNHLEGEPILGPAEFVEEFPATHAYPASFLAKDVSYPWVVLHKGQLEDVAHQFLLNIERRYYPVFANEVFVVFNESRKLPGIGRSSSHYDSFLKKLAGHQEKKPPDHILATSRTPRPDIATLSVEQIREEMNRRYTHTKGEDSYFGYLHTHLWDKVRFRELDRHISEMMPSLSQKSVLEFGSGSGRQIRFVADCQEYVGIDLSDVAIEQARTRFHDQPHLHFERMDCANLHFPAERFDVVLAVEMIEHVHDPAKVIAEACRVLKPGGWLILNSANRDSLHLRIVRKLGLPEFKATREHIHEFTYKEMKQLMERLGLVVEKSAGVFLLPYYGIPGIDGIVRHLTNDDPEIVEVFRDLGERAGAEYTYEFVIAARKQ